MWSFIASETGFFLMLIIAYVFYNAYPQAHGGPTAASVLDVKKTGIFTAFLLASSGTLWVAERAVHKRDHGATVRWLVLTIVLGAVFLVGQANEYLGLFRSGVSLTSNLWATTFFTLTGFHGLHVTVGLIMLGIVLGLTLAGDYKKKPSKILNTIGLYWHFVDVVWIVVFTVVYLRAK
jgi:heme/copper-type cytochrome/quinol oxidase subunit 3